MYEIFSLIFIASCIITRNPTYAVAASLFGVASAGLTIARKIGETKKEDEEVKHNEY